MCVRERENEREINGLVREREEEKGRVNYKEMGRGLWERM